MAPGIHTLILAVAIAMTSSLSPAPAAAQELDRPWLDSELKDIDEEQENYSAFWSRAVEPNKTSWQERVDRAGALFRQPSKRSFTQAESLLLDAIRLAPEQPVAHWLLGHAYYLMGRFEACAKARAQVAKLNPDFEPPALLRGVSNLDFGIGVCLALSGDHVGALHHYKRTMAHGDDAPTVSYAIRWRIGESYMALGRLDEAIGALKEGVRLGSMDVIVHYALAAAYDRNEQSARARKALQFALRRDSTQALLSVPNRHIAPPEDVFYYDALAKMQPPLRGRSAPVSSRNSALAIVKFRRFLSGHKRGPWIRRARHHIASLSREPLSAAGTWQHGGAGMDAKLVRAAVAKQHPALQRCVKATPGVVYTVAVTALIEKKAGTAPSFGRAGPSAGVRTRHYEEIESDPAQIAASMECLERAAARLALPKAKGPAGESVTVEFPVVAQ